MIDKFDLLKANYLGKFEGAVTLCKRYQPAACPTRLTIYLSQIMVDFAREAKTLGQEMADAEWRQIMAQKEKEEGK